MSVCLGLGANNELILAPEQITCTYKVFTQFETISINSLNGITGLNALFSEYFDFDLSLFSLISGGLIVSFVSGHILGRIISPWRKVM